VRENRTHGSMRQREAETTSRQRPCGRRSLPLTLHMAYPEYLRERARALRLEQHITIDELAERFALPRGTIYYWVRDIPLGKPRRGTAGSRRGNLAMQRKYRLLREEAYAAGVRCFQVLSAEPTFRDFVVLYMAEGYKRSRNSVAVCNSDPRAMTLATTWLRRLSSRPLQYAVSYHADQELPQLCAFWGELLGIDPAVVRVYRKSNSGQLTGRRWRCQHGVLTVRTHDTALRAKLQAWMDLVQASWE